MTTFFPTRPTASEIPLRPVEPAHDLRAEKAISANEFAILRRHALLDGCKWDPQVGDIDTLSPFPLVMKSSVWRKLASQAEQLTAEAISAEEEVSQRPELLGCLGFPIPLRKVLAERTPLTPAAGRVIRFDFHYTADGWRISEANSDVPGGFSEASCFTELMAQHFPNLRPAGNPGEIWSEALVGAVGFPGAVALLSSPGYMEDHQVIAFLAAQLRKRGCLTYLAKPEQIRWRDGMAYLDAWHQGPLAVILKFYQAEWLSRLPEESGCRNLFRGGKTPVANPALAVISESKRFPLIWDKLSTRLPLWQSLLPETRDPREAPWSRDDGWLVKTAMCNTGDTVSIRELMSPAGWLRTRLAVLLSPSHWMAQRRFESVSIGTPAGPRHVCVGIYTVNGRAAGAYARLSKKPVIDFSAADAALLLEGDD